MALLLLTILIAPLPVILVLAGRGAVVASAALPLRRKIRPITIRTPPLNSAETPGKARRRGAMRSIDAPSPGPARLAEPSG